MDKKPRQNLNSVCRSALTHWGFPAQADHAQEECAELITAISHARRLRPGSMDEVIEEAVDVRIMVTQILMSLDQSKVDAMEQKKLNKVVDLIRADRQLKGQPRPNILGET